MLKGMAVGEEGVGNKRLAAVNGDLALSMVLAPSETTTGAGVTACKASLITLMLVL